MLQFPDTQHRAIAYSPLPSVQAQYYSYIITPQYHSYIQPICCLGWLTWKTEGTEDIGLIKQANWTFDARTIIGRSASILFTGEYPTQLLTNLALASINANPEMLNFNPIL